MSLKRGVVRLALGWALVLALSAPGRAQTVTGTLQGNVQDMQGGVLPGVSVVLRNLETGQERGVVTNDKGFTARVELYNAFNRPQFGFPSADLNATTFGRITSTATGYRAQTLQLTLRYQF